ncbi:hypothetical protein [Streptomyces sp. XD-27]|uniref:hypothetical protein n=1 Tax=Streptomyces sp. XD-27 TaxID=3062779 RepID=UPI0026F444AC|nr:hypothetical protein [Streptomyces sp. XD-27]WKX71392.1 hypothetical protein Q3Y56_17085 [Streptomyces sp. XD-27]
MTAQPRLLPWPGPAGQPAYLISDDGTDSHLTKLADEMEAVQLRMGTEMIQHARMLVDNRKADTRELRFLVNRLTEALTDALRIAESRGMRLDALRPSSIAELPVSTAPQGRGSKCSKLRNEEETAR